jgi:hypothetical protein
MQAGEVDRWCSPPDKEIQVMANTNVNGQGSQRKSLASQLDRLDRIIDVLAEGLNEAVADIVRQTVASAVQQTVETVLREVLSRPEVLRALAPPAPVAQPAPVQPVRSPSLLRRCCGWLWNKLSSACASLRGKLTSAGMALSNKLGAAAKQVGHVVAEATRRSVRLCLQAPLLVRLSGKLLGGLVGWARRHPRAIAASVLVGVAVGLGGYLAGPVVSSTTLGLVGAGISLASSVLAPLFRLFRGFQVPARTA